MSGPKLHHYVPQFYLRRFSDEKGRLWVWDNTRDASFRTTPTRIAAETYFYWISELAEAGHDPLTMEKQFSDLEGQVSLVTDQWLEWLAELEPGQPIPIPDENREFIALYVALQHLRTADTRDIVCALALGAESETLSEAERTRVHTKLLWDLKTVYRLANSIRDCIWVFGRNATGVPFITSDNPVAFKTPDNRQWRRLGIPSLSPGAYVVFPWSPTIVMYCHERNYWAKRNLSKFDACLSPVTFDSDMVHHENSGQVFMASRFVISLRNDFSFVREFFASNVSRSGSEQAMGDRADEFLNHWKAAHVDSGPSAELEDAAERLSSQCRADAQRAGINAHFLEIAANGDLTSYMLAALEAAAHGGGSRPH